MNILKYISKCKTKHLNNHLKYFRQTLTRTRYDLVTGNE